MTVVVLVTTVKMLRGAQDTKKITEIVVRRMLVLLFLFFLRMAVTDRSELFRFCWDFLKVK